MKCVTAIATDSSHKDVGIILITRICYIDTNCQQVSFTLTQLNGLTITYRQFVSDRAP